MPNSRLPRSSAPDVVFWLVLLLSAADRLVLLDVFGFRYTGDDDGIFWQAARDFGQGIFHEPYFYGQAYNPMLEALLAAPLLWLGVPPHVALPLITSLLALAPFWSFALWHRKHGRHMAGIAFAAIPLLLPIEWGMMTMITRGSVTGVAVLAAYPWALGIARVPLRYALCAFVVGMAVFFNPNAAVFGLAAGVHLMMTTRITGRSFVMGALGLVPAALLYFGARAFYLQRPWRIAHHLEVGFAELSGTWLPPALFDLDKHFLYLCPLWWHNGQVVLWAIALCAVLLCWKHERAIPVALLASGFCIYVSFHATKVYDGTISPLFSVSRMYLAVPLLLGFALAPLLGMCSIRRSLPISIAIVCMGFAITKTVRACGVVDRWIANQKELHVPVLELPLDALRVECRELAALAKTERADLLLPIRSSPDSKARFHCYHCAFLVPDLPRTFGPGFDRRWWLRQEEQLLVHPRILVTGGDTLNWRRIVSAHRNVRRIPNDHMVLHMIKDNDLPVHRLRLKLGMEW